MISPEILPIPGYLLEFIGPFLISAIIALATFAAIRLTGLKNHRSHSLFYFLPLLAPVLYYLYKPPILYFGEERLVQRIIENGDMNILVFEVERTLNPVGLIILISLSCSAILYIVLSLYGPAIMYRLLKVKVDTQLQYSDLHKSVEKIAKMSEVRTPNVGIIESIEPNAFTLGAGKNTGVIFTTGLLHILNKQELEAVIAHEVAHIKNKDYRISTIASCLRTASFLNPVSHLVTSKILREREHLADQVSTKIFGRPEALGLALVKIWEVSKNMQTSRTMFVADLMGISNIRSNALSLHPSLERRLETLLDTSSSNPEKRKDIFKTGSLILLFSVIMIMGLSNLNFLRVGLFVSGPIQPSTNGVKPFLEPTPFGVTFNIFSKTNEGQVDLVVLPLHSPLFTERPFSLLSKENSVSTVIQQPVN